MENDAYLLRLSCYIHRNPLRAGLVKRLSEYTWSSYRFYAYGKKGPDWLNSELILNQLAGKEPYKSYRQKVQKYSDESENVWEDIKHGLIYGSQDFIEKIKERYLSDQKDAELPQHNSMFADFEPEVILQKASQLLAFDLNCIVSKRLLPEEKGKRDCIIYLLWETGRFSNKKIGSLVGLTYSSISKQVGLFKNRLSVDRDLRTKYKDLNSQFKV